MGLRCTRWFVVATMGLAGCLHHPPLPTDAVAALHEAAAGSTGVDLVYEGTVRRRGAPEAPLYRYERRVLDLEEGVRSSHVTFSPAGDPVVLHQADHSPTYALRGFHEIHTQRGLVGQVEVLEDGTAVYETTMGGRTRTRVEAPGAPLHVGPTLFGYVRTHWDSLVAGDVHPVRFVVLQKRRSYRFELQMVDGPAGTPTFAMAPTDPFVALGVPSIELVFDRDRNILRYEGLVPPLDGVGDRLRTLDATVTYDLVAEEYR